MVIKVVLQSLLLTLSATATSATNMNADQAFTAGNFAEAYAAYASQLKQYPKDVHALARAAELDLYDDRLDEADRQFHALQALDPKSVPARRGLAEIAARRGTGGQYNITSTSATATLPFLASEPLPVIKLKLNGTREANFMIDTGAPGVVIDPAVAKSLGLELKSGGVGMFGGGASGQIMETQIGKINAGGMEVQNVPAIAMPLNDAPAPKGMKIDGIIGTSFFYHFLATIDFAAQRLVLRPRSSSAAFAREAAERGDAIAEMWYVPDHFIFAKAQINGNYTALLNVDTGGEGFGLQATKPTVDAAGIALDTAHPGKFMTPVGEVPIIPFKAKVALGPHRAMQVDGKYFPSGDQYGIFPFSVGGTLSDQFFRGAAVTFDFEQMLLVVSAGVVEK